MKFTRRFAKRGRVEIIPMIDTILILLIFYMTFSSFSVTENEIAARLPVKPREGTTAIVQTPVDIRLHVKNKDEITMLGAGTMTLTDLAVQLQTYNLMEGSLVNVVIEAEPETVYADVVGALDACAQARLTNVAFRAIKDDKAAAPGNAP